ncbi:MAG: hypothetical protein BWK80_18280 [Desulfobacteraceae bacterium IS3]|nr:MAG: hypothetical protein BWK80_18280 [Desulfobacteraceae bacterium IS3]
MEDTIKYPAMMSPLASLQTGFTSKSQPVLQWYISGPWQGQIEFTLNEEESPDPVLVTNIDGPAQEGIYQINLADYNVSLKPNTEYEWFVVIVTNPSERSADFLGSATMMYVEPSDALKNEIADTPAEKQHYLYADKGYWYDTIEHLCRLIAVEPNNSRLREERMRLLKQVDLSVAAAYDAKSISAF